MTRNSEKLLAIPEGPSDSVLNQVIQDYLESPEYEKLYSATMVKNWLLDWVRSLELVSGKEVSKFLDTIDTRVDLPNVLLVFVAAMHTDRDFKTITINILSLGSDKPFATFHDEGNIVGPAVVRINIDHPIFDETSLDIADFSEDGQYTQAFIEFMSALAEAQVYIELHPNYQPDNELIYEQLRKFLGTPYFVAVPVRLDENASGVIDIRNHRTNAKIIFPFVGYEYDYDYDRNRGFVGNQTHYLAGEEKISFFRFILDNEPFSHVDIDGHIETTFEGITSVTEEDFLPVPRLQIKKRFLNHDNTTYRIQVMYLELSEENRKAIIDNINQSVFDFEQLRTFDEKLNSAKSNINLDSTDSAAH